MSADAERRYAEFERLEAKAERLADLRFDLPPTTAPPFEFTTCPDCGDRYGVPSNDDRCAYCKEPRDWQLCDGSDYPDCKTRGQCPCMGDIQCRRCGEWTHTSREDYWGCEHCRGRAA